MVIFGGAGSEVKEFLSPDLRAQEGQPGIAEQKNWTNPSPLIN
jgi:hypothetical protein